MANIITLSRIPLLFIYIALLYYGGGVAQLWCVPFIVLITSMDMLDGIIARKFGEVSLLGSTLDIAVDRAFEIILWVIYAHLGLIPIIIPLIVITRGTLTDAVRAVGLSGGEAAFDQLKHPISQFVVSSRLMRDFYGVTKAFAFAFVTASLGLRTLGHAWAGRVHLLALTLVWIAIMLTIIRGLPVLIESYRLFKNPPLLKSKEDDT